MARPISRFRYGTTLDSFVDVVYPLVFDQVLCWRQPAPNSDRVRNDAGVTDGWLAGRDFMMTGNLRWITPATWSPGGLGVQGFIDWASAAQPFRFIPDNTNENFFVDNCFLDDPFMDWKPGFESSNDSQAAALTIRNSAIDFMAALRGVMFEYLPGTDILTWTPGTFTRASTATYIDRTPKVATAASGVIRDAHYGSNLVRSTLLEAPGATNLLLQSEDLTTTWVAGAGATVTSNTLTAPDGNLTADTINFIHTSSDNLVHQLVTVANPANRLYVFSFWMADGTLTYNGNGPAILIRRGDGTQALTFTQSSGLKVADTITQVNGVVWRRLYCTYQADATTNANIDVFLRNNTSTGTYFAWGMQLEDKTSQGDYTPTPSSYIKTTTATVARAIEALSFPFAPVPQAMWVYLKFVERGTIQMGNSQNGRLLQISSAGNANPRFIIYENAANSPYQVGNFDPSNASVVRAATVVPNYGDTVEILAQLFADGSVKITQAINGGAEVASTQSGALTIQSSWSTPVVVTLNQQTGGFSDYQVVRIGAGTKVGTIAQARVV